MSRRRRAAPAIAGDDLVRQLLRHGAYFLAPGQDIIDAAERLAGLQIIQVHRSHVVRCAEPLDRDFPPARRDCDGLIELRASADEGGGDYRCPSCERLVFPAHDEKREHELLTVFLDQRGIEAFLLEHCRALATGHTFEGGVLTVPVAGLNAFVCLLDFCSDHRVLRRAAAIAQPCVFVTAGPDAARRVLDEPAICHIELADIVIGTVDLLARLTERAQREVTTVSNVDVPVYVVGRAPAAPAVTAPAMMRRFAIRLDDDGFWIDNLLVIGPRRTTAIRVLQELIRRFARALAEGAGVRPMTAEQLADALEGGDEIIDPDSVRRTIDRIRADIAGTVRRQTGNPIADDDIIETASRSSGARKTKGYRLNPGIVTLGAPRR